MFRWSSYFCCSSNKIKHPSNQCNVQEIGALFHQAPTKPSQNGEPLCFPMQKPLFTKEFYGSCCQPPSTLSRHPANRWPDTSQATKIPCRHLHDNSHSSLRKIVETEGSEPSLFFVFGTKPSKAIMNVMIYWLVDACLQLHWQFRFYCMVDSSDNWEYSFLKCHKIWETWEMADRH